MGNDGGSIPKRRELVREAAKAPTASQIKEALAESQDHAWNHCALSSRPLAAPVVSDSAGTLYNKDAVLEFLLAEEGSSEKSEGEKRTGGRVRGVRDVVEVRFEEGSGEDGKGWVCPVTREEMGPGAKAVYVVPCGHAFAGSVVREVAERVCVQCNEPYAENDVIPILPTAATDIARLTLRIKTLQEKGLTHALKKAPGSKKRKKATSAAAEAANGSAASPAETKPTSSSSDDNKALTKPTTKSDKKPTPAEPRASTGIKNASTAYLTKRVLAEQEARNKRRKTEQNDNVRSLFSQDGGAGGKVDVRNSRDYMTRGFSIGGR